jgi:uncharacterized membrane protein YhaH (DUF805 family)
MAKPRGYFRLDFKDIFSARGRVDRMTFLVYNVLYNVLSFALALLSGFGFSIYAESTGDDSNLSFALAIGLGTTLPLLYPVVCNLIKRLHDLGLAAIAAIVPVALNLAHQFAGLEKEVAYLPEAFSEYALQAEPYLLGLSLVTGFSLLLIPGQKTANRYGPSPNEYFGGKTALPKPNVLEG